MSTCKSCGAAILWVRMQGSAKRMPLDPDRRADGNVRLVGREGNTPYAVVVRPGRGEYVSHFVTCPQAAEHRTRP